MKAVTLLLLALVCPGAALAQLVPNSKNFSLPIQRAALQATVRLSTRVGPGREIGSGVLVGQDNRSVFLLTAAHVVGGGRLRVGTFWRNGLAPAPGPREKQLLYRDIRADVALVRIFTAGPVPGLMPICPPELAPQGRFAAMSIGTESGSPDGGPWAWTCWAQEKGIRIVTDRSPWYGRSGGPLFSSKGFVVGICAARQPNMPRGAGQGYFATLPAIHQACRAAGHEWLIRQSPEVLARYRPRQPQPQLQLGISQTPIFPMQPPACLPSR